MQKVVIGHITSSDISKMGKVHFGYLAIKTIDHEDIKVKVTAFTKFDTLDVGAKVEIELKSVGEEAILTVENIRSIN
ncbi:MAG: hypothetical protein RTV31_08760 [Candidatus Thorarchaeota archaeon]